MDKICSKCKQPIDRERRKTRDKKKELEQKKEYYNNNRNRLKSLAKLHNYIRKIKVKQQICTICNEEKKLQLASIDHTYTENPKDYMWLCQSCHHLYDSSRGEKEAIRRGESSSSEMAVSRPKPDSKLPEDLCKCGKSYKSHFIDNTYKTCEYLELKEKHPEPICPKCEFFISNINKFGTSQCKELDIRLAYSDYPMACVHFNPKTEPEKNGNEEEWECPICKKVVFIGYTVHRSCLDDLMEKLKNTIKKGD